MLIAIIRTIQASAFPVQLVDTDGVINKLEGKPKADNSLIYFDINLFVFADCVPSLMILTSDDQEKIRMTKVDPFYVRGPVI